MNRYSIAVVFVCLSFCAATAAAQPSFTNHLPVDSPVLYRQFFRFHASFNDWVATKTAGQPAAAVATLNRQAASAFGLKENDHQQVSAITTSIARELRGIDKEEITHANGRARYEQHPIPSVMQQFEKRREEAVSRGVTQLQRTLAADVWTSLRNYINGPYRNEIKVR